MRYNYLRERFPIRKNMQKFFRKFLCLFFTILFSLFFSLPALAATETYDFEDNQIPTGWTTGGNANWSITNVNPLYGSYSALSGDIADSQLTWIKTTKTVVDGNITFYWKTSSEPNYDFALFCVDRDPCNRDHYDAVTSGLMANPTQVSFAVGSGEHTFTWVYDKDASTSNGTDDFRLDDVVIPEADVAPATISTSSQITTTDIVIYLIVFLVLFFFFGNLGRWIITANVFKIDFYSPGRSRWIAKIQHWKYKRSLRNKRYV